MKRYWRIKYLKYGVEIIDDHGEEVPLSRSPNTRCVRNARKQFEWCLKEEIKKWNEKLHGRVSTYYHQPEGLIAESIVAGHNVFIGKWSRDMRITEMYNRVRTEAINFDKLSGTTVIKGKICSIYPTA